MALKGDPRSVVERLWRGELSSAGRAAKASLIPAALLYGWGAAARVAFWRSLRRRRTALRVISIGNLTVGGNGKTPMALYVARKLTDSGIAAAIVSRGYGGSLGSGAPLLVSDGHQTLLSAEQAGDEAVMMAKSFTGPVAIARRRLEAIQMLERAGGLDAVVLDDAFQHVRLPRDVDLLVVNAARGFGNGWTLPAGPLRERLGAMRRADAVICLGSGHSADGFTPAQVALLGRARVLRGTIRPCAMVQAEAGRWRELPLGLTGRRVLAVSGLADPHAFYTMIRELEADLAGVLEYPDHHAYNSTDWHDISAAARDADIVLTTEKDLVKLERFPFARDSLYALRLEILMGADERALLELIAPHAAPPAAARA